MANLSADFASIIITASISLASHYLTTKGTGQAVSSSYTILQIGTKKHFILQIIYLDERPINRHCFLPTLLCCIHHGNSKITSQHHMKSSVLRPRRANGHEAVVNGPPSHPEQ